MDRHYEGIFTRFLNIYSPARFFCVEIPSVTLLEESVGYQMDPSDRKEIKCRHSLFIDDLKTSEKPPKAEDSK